MQKSLINPSIFQPFLESASNAGAKGQAQYFTPLAVGRALAMALPRYRPVIVDLSSGAGHLLHGSARPSTESLLGCDIDPCALINQHGVVSDFHGIHRIVGDNAKLLPLMRTVEFVADLFVLNPPWDLHVYREPLASLAQSEVLAVAEAFKAHDGRTGRDTIDSTVAALCFALDRCSTMGEGFIIANEATLQRLILDLAAPHRALAFHCWAHLIFNGNLCQPGVATDEPSDFQTGILYFARDHHSGLHPDARWSGGRVRNVTELEESCRHIFTKRLEWREGSEVRSHNCTDDTAKLWHAVAEEWDRLNPPATDPRKRHYNLWLTPNGTIDAEVSLYDQRSSRVTQEQAKALFHLKDKKPMQLVMLRSERQLLQRAALDPQSPWRVDPRLQTAVTQSVEQYQIVRAPLYPLSPIMRLAYLDEHDDILCERRLGAFKADHSYKLRSTTVAVRREGTKINMAGQCDDVQWDGQELAFFITDGDGRERVFMEARLRAENIRISILQPAEKPGSQDEDDIELCPIDYTLQELVHHFNIPDVLDVARVNPEGYQRNLDLLKQIEELCAAS